MKKGPRRVSSDGPVLPSKLLERVHEAADGRHASVSSSSFSRAGPSRKALRRQKKQLKKKRAIMLSEQNERRARKKRVVEEDDDHVAQESSDHKEEEEDHEEEDEEEEVSAAAPAEPPKSSYVPPHLRGGASSSSTALKKAVRGVLNKLAEGTLHSSAAKIAELVLEYSRSGVIDCLCGEMVSDTSADATTSVTNKLVAVFAALVGILYHEQNMGLLLPSTVTELLVGKFEEMYVNEDVKRALNVALFLGYLFHFGVIGATIIVDFCKRLANSFGQMDVELLLKLMQLVGMKLRSDVPGELVALLATVSDKTAALKLSSENGQVDLKTQFMLETLSSIKNNRYMNVDEHLTQINKAVKLQRGEVAIRNQGF